MRIKESNVLIVANLTYNSNYIIRCEGSRARSKSEVKQWMNVAVKYTFHI